MLAPLLLALLVAGCTPERDRGRVQSEWAMTFRELNIVPTFPPREDFQVGDLYVTHYDPNSPILQKKWDDLNDEEKAIRSKVGMHVRLMRLDLRKELSAEYAFRLSAPSSGFDPNRLDDVPAIAVASAKVAVANDSIVKKQQEIKAETDKIKAAQDTISTATNDLAKVKTAQTRADADLAEATKRAGELTNLRKAEDEARKAFATTETAVAAKQKEVDGEADEDKKAKLQAELKLLQKDRDITQTQMNAASANVSAANTALKNIDALRTDADKAKQTIRDAEDTLERAKLAEQPKITDAQAKVEKLNTELTGLKEKASAAKTEYDALVTAAKLLNLGQPAYAGRNVYTGEALDKAAASTQNPDSVNRMRLVAFPEFATASYTGVDAAAMIPIEAVNLGISASSQNVSNVTVKVPAAESYALPVATMMSMLYDSTGSNRNLKKEIVSSLLDYPSATFIASGASTKSGQLSSAPDLYLTVICEVFYARALDVAVSYRQAGGGRVTVSISATPQPGGASGGSTDSLESMISSVQSRIGQTQIVPGGSIQIVSGNSFGVGLRRTFDRPVAIGYRGFIIPLVLDNGTPKVAGRPTISSGMGTLNTDLYKRLNEGK